MIPIQVKLQGFMSYRDEATLNFEGSPLWMLSGNNGAGKSTVFDAMKFALYGTHRRGSQFAEGLIHHGSSSMRVEFDFQSGSDVYRIVRTLTLKGASSFQAFHLKGPGLERQGISGPVAIEETDSKKGLQRFITEHIGLNEQTFSSAVMLEQGKSDVLLSADAELRHALLSQIVDLSGFEQLYQLAEEGRKTAKAEEELLNRKLSTTSPVDESALEELREKIEFLREETQIKRGRLENILRLQGQVQRWEELNSEIQSLEGQVKAQNTLLEQAETIRLNLARLESLEKDVPNLRVWVELQNQKHELKAEIDKLIEDEKAEKETIQKATDEKQEQERQYQNLVVEIARLEAQRETASDTIFKIGPLLPQHQNWLKLREELKQIDENLAQFPVDLKEQIEQVKTALLSATEIQQIVPLLRRLCDTREEWNTTVQNQNALRGERTRLHDDIRLAQDALQTADERLGQVETEFNLAQEAKTQASTLVKLAQDAMVRFGEVEHESTCHYCGQVLDEEHREREHLRLKEEFEAATSDYTNKSATLKELCEEVESVRKHQKGCSEAGNDLAKQLQKVESNLESLDRDLEREAASAIDIVAELPLLWASKVKADAKGNSDLPVELTGTYPDKPQISALEIVAQRKTGLQEQTDDLERRLREQHRLSDRREDVARRFQELDLICSSMPTDLQRRYDEAVTIVETSKVALSQATKQRDLASNGADEAQKRANEAYLRSHKIGRDLENTQNAVENLQKQGETIISLFPIGFDAQSLDKGTLAKLEYEKSLLDAQNLRSQEKQLVDIEVRQGELLFNLNLKSQERAKIPVEAQISLSQLKIEEEALKGEMRESESQRTAWENERSSMENAKQQRQDLQKQHDEASKSARLHAILAEKLGRDGLQRQLLKEAETDIIDAANDVLDRISDGDLRLELRDEDSPVVAGNRKGSSRALDFVVYNSLMGKPQPMHPAFLSGSQRFRVAVSLALGIGHYASHGRGRVESVIIDEGFGSLDKQGRHEMIEELRELKTVLKRVILVSHQEEFSEAFANRYHIEIVDGTSRVGLLYTAIN